MGGLRKPFARPWAATGRMAAVGLALAGCAPAAPPSEAELPTRARLAGTTIVPLLDDEQPLVVARLEGVGEARLLLDTGAEFSWIDDAFAARSGLPREPLGATLNGIYGATRIAERTRVARVEIGAMVVSDFAPPLIRSMRDDVDGSIGQDLLRMTDVVVDGPGRRLILVPKGGWERASRALFEPGNVALDYAVDWTRGIPVVRVPVAELDGERAFGVDTGIGRMTVTRGLAQELGLERLAAERGSDLTGASPVVPTYAVRGLALQDLTVHDDAFEAPENRLGWGVLRGFVIVFDNGAGRMLLFPDPAWASGAEGSTADAHGD